MYYDIIDDNGFDVLVDDDIDWNYSSDKILVYLDEPIAMQNQWRDYCDDDFEIEEEDY